MFTSDNPYYAQVRLLVGVLPFVAMERCFALKGGTAINLFVRDLPRLSVDIDLAYLPLGERDVLVDQVGVWLNHSELALGLAAEQIRGARGLVVQKLAEVHEAASSVSGSGA